MAFNRESCDYQCFKNGKTRGEVAAVLGVTYPTFLRKIDNMSQWKIDEMESLVKLFDLSDIDRNRMFGLGDQCDFSITNSLP